MKEQFDVFVSYNSNDKNKVEKIIKALKLRGLRVWFDDEQIPKGSEWEEKVKLGIPQSRSAIIFLGTNDIGDTQEKEIDAIIAKCKPIYHTSDKKSIFWRKNPRDSEEKLIIPICLPGVRIKDFDKDSFKELSLMQVARRSAVEFKKINDPDGIRQVYSSIRGRNASSDFDFLIAHREVKHISEDAEEICVRLKKNYDLNSWSRSQNTSRNDNRDETELDMLSFIKDIVILIDRDSTVTNPQVWNTPKWKEFCKECNKNQNRIIFVSFSSDQDSVSPSKPMPVVPPGLEKQLGTTFTVKQETIQAVKKAIRNEKEAKKIENLKGREFYDGDSFINALKSTLGSSYFYSKKVEEYREEILKSSKNEKVFSPIFFSRPIKKQHKSLDELAYQITGREPLTKAPKLIWIVAAATVILGAFTFNLFVTKGPSVFDIKMICPTESMIFVGAETKEFGCYFREEYKSDDINIQWDLYGVGKLKRADGFQNLYIPPEKLEAYQQRDVKIVAIISDNKGRRRNVQSADLRLFPIEELDSVLDSANLSHSYVKRVGIAFKKGSYKISDHEEKLLETFVKETIARKKKRGQFYKGEQLAVKYIITCYTDKSGFRKPTEERLENELRSSGKEIPSDRKSSEWRKALNQQFSKWRAKSVNRALEECIYRTVTSFDHAKIIEIYARGEEKPQTVCEVESYIVDRHN